MSLTRKQESLSASSLSVTVWLRSLLTANPRLLRWKLAVVRTIGVEPQAQGHQVKLLPAIQVRPFVLRGKTDARDAQAIWVAAQQFHIRAVPVKSQQQQACLALHRMRAQLMKIRIMQTNALRGLLYEFGIALPEGHRLLLQRVKSEIAQAQDKLPGVVTESVLEQLSRVDRLQDDIDHMDKRLVALGKQNQQMLAVPTIPGSGPLTATALVSTATDLSGARATGRPGPGP